VLTNALTGALIGAAILGGPALSFFVFWAQENHGWKARIACVVLGIAMCGAGIGAPTGIAAGQPDKPRPEGLCPQGNVMAADDNPVAKGCIPAELAKTISRDMSN